MKQPKFIHLHVHSDYSMIDGLAKVQNLIKHAKLLKMPAIAITDFTNMCGLVKFYSSAHNSGIKAIIGVDFLIENKTHFINHYYEITCLASSKIGYQNLIILISKAYQHRTNNKQKPNIQYSWLSTYHEGLIILSGGYQGDIGQSLIQNNSLQTKQYLSFYMKYFPDRYYLEITRTGKKYEELYLNHAVELSIKYTLPLVATNNVRFIHQKDFQTHEIRIAINQGVTLETIQKSQQYTSQQFMRNEQEMCKLFSDIPESLKNSVEIAKRCNVIINFNQCILPNFPTNIIPIEKFLIKQAQQGLEERLIVLFPDQKERYTKRKDYDQRLKLELTMINKMGFPGYFLIVMEFIQWAKKNDIPVGPGRGSGASSLVAYALKITDLNPLQFNLLFERFLNPERISMPDLDIDFCMDKRDLVIDHVISRYGQDSVSQIITFSTMTARAVIKDVGRALGYPYSFVDKISKLIPLEPKITLKKAFKIEPKLQISYNNNEDIKLLVNIAKNLEGVIKNFGKHAGGIVISPTKMTDFSPLYYDKDGKYPMTQFDKDDIEKIGLIKFDFLGLRTLTIIDSSIKMINNHFLQNNLKPINISLIPLNDQTSFKKLQTAETTAIFQLESQGMQELIKRLQPDCFEDIIALIALFRPGPLQSGMVDNFINRKHGHEEISYPDEKCQHKKLQPVLESTYGIILYQEQVMQIAQVLAGYTLEHADILRRAIGKKKPEEMAKQRSIFESGAKKLGFDSKLSIKIFNLVEKFSGYGFNKSHSAAYALISYQTLWLKTHYPHEFMAATLNADIDNIDKITRLIRECQRLGIKIQPPNINIGEYYFYVNNQKEIVYGIGAIKGIGTNTIEYIIQQRNKHGPFNNLFTLCSFSNTKKISYRILEKLILSGACDCFKSPRITLIKSLNSTIKMAGQYIKNQIHCQNDMFNMLIPTTPVSIYENNISTWSEQTLLEKEKEILGIYLNNHPITQYTNEIKHYTNLIPLTNITNIASVSKNTIITIAGLLTSTRIINSKYGHKIALCTLENDLTQVNVIIYKDLLTKTQHYLNKQILLFIQGVINIDQKTNNIAIIAKNINDIHYIRKKYAQNLSITLQENQINDNLLHSLYTILKKYKNGSLPVYLYYQKQNMQILLRCGKKWQIELTEELLNDLHILIGKQYIQIKFN